MDAFNQFNSFASRCAEFTYEELQIFQQIAEVRKVAKKEIILREGEVCDFEAYIVSGCLRSFCIDENGVETVLQFAVEDWWISDMGSFTDRTPSKMTIEALEDSVIIVLSVSQKHLLLTQVPKFERMFRIMVQKHLAATQNRLIYALSKSATEKYLEFIRLYPTISQRVAQHHIAAYLGISAEFLSKIRSKLNKA